LYLPVFDSFSPDRNAVASLLAQIQWSRYFDDILPPTDDGILFVLRSCSKSYTYTIHGPTVHFVEMGDFHDTRFASMKKSTNYLQIKSIADSTKEGLKYKTDYCSLEINVYPTIVRILGSC
jgi:hypothetical protein